jgi:hypothetical protein
MMTRRKERECRPVVSGLSACGRVASVAVAARLLGELATQEERWAN